MALVYLKNDNKARFPSILGKLAVLSLSRCPLRGCVDGEVFHALHFSAWNVPRPSVGLFFQVKDKKFGNQVHVERTRAAK